MAAKEAQRRRTQMVWSKAKAEYRAMQEVWRRQRLKERQAAFKQQFDKACAQLSTLET